VNGVATLGKLVNGVAPFNMSTELASGVAPLANGENGGRRGTGRFMCRRAISAAERPSTERIVGIRPRRMLAPAMLCVMSGVRVWRMQLLCVQQ
jgi:hypothetical protein